MKKYKPRNGSRLNQEQANRYGQRIAQLIGDGGEVTAEAILNDAKSPKSPLHDFFEWDDSEAAKKFRIHQARYLAGNIAEVMIIEGKQSEQRSFFNVSKGKNETVYVTVQKAISNDGYKQQLLDRLIRHLQNTTDVMKLFKEHV